MSIFVWSALTSVVILKRYKYPYYNILNYINSWSDSVEVVVELQLLCWVTRGARDMVASTMGYKLPSDMIP